MLELKPVKAHEIPVHLLRQKDTWDLQVFYEMAVSDPTHWMSFLIVEGTDLVGAVLYSQSRLYRTFYVDTLIVDEPLREMPLMRECVRLARDMGHILAAGLGYPLLGSSTEWSLEAMRRMYGESFDGRLVEYTICEPVRTEEN